MVTKTDSRGQKNVSMSATSQQTMLWNINKKKDSFLQDMSVMLAFHLSILRNFLGVSFNFFFVLWWIGCNLVYHCILSWLTPSLSYSAFGLALRLLFQFIEIVLSRYSLFLISSWQEQGKLCLSINLKLFPLVGKEFWVKITHINKTSVTISGVKRAEKRDAVFKELSRGRVMTSNSQSSGFKINSFLKKSTKWDVLLLA